MTASAEATIDPILSEAYHTDPAGVIARLRQDDPVHYIPGVDAWMICRYDDVLRLFTDPNVTNDPRAYAHYQQAPEGSYARWTSEHGLFSAPPDEHARQRRLVSAALTPRAVARMEDQVREVVEAHAKPLRGREDVVDLIAEFTGRVPNAVITRITGVPAYSDAEERFRQLMTEVISGISPFLDDEMRKIAQNAIQELCEYVRELAVERRADPKEDLISDLVRAHDADDRMTNDEIVLMVAALVSAGSETTAMGGALGIKSLLQHPDQLALLRADRSLLPNAVDELLRYDFGAVGLPRYALNDFELRGKAIRKGQLLMLNFHGAHRDPSVFADPDRLDVTRDTSRLAIFGRGPHYCLGANLARQELRCMIESALDFLPPGASLLEDEIEVTRIAMFSRMETLPVAFAPGA